MVFLNDDMEDYLPIKHKNYSPLDCLPPSLEEAINCFIIANAIMDIEYRIDNHRSMMINCSRFISVQDIVLVRVYEYLEKNKESD